MDPTGGKGTLEGVACSGTGMGSAGASELARAGEPARSVPDAAGGEADALAAAGSGLSTAAGVPDKARLIKGGEQGRGEQENNQNGANEQ